MGKDTTYKRLTKYSIEFMTPHESNTIRHTAVKAGIFQSEFGIRAGFPCRSWRPTHSTKPGTKTTATVIKVALSGSLILEELPVTLLFPSASEDFSRTQMGPTYAST